MRKQGGRLRWLAPLAVVMMILAAACGDDDGDDADATDDATEEATDGATDEAADGGDEEAGGPGSFGCSDLIPDCSGTITPSEGLTEGATVTIEASGFSPNLGLGINQCADQDDPDHGITGDTTADDCNLRGIGNTESDAEGNVSAEFTVVAGQTMIDNTGAGRTCDATHDCVISVGELVPGDAERITFKVTFA